MNDLNHSATVNKVAESPSRDDGPSEDGPSSFETGHQSGPSLIERFAGLFRPKTGSSLREDIADALAEAGDGESFTPGERAMLHNILRLREVRVEDVMVPRSEIAAVEQHTSLGDLLSLFEESGHSRMPVYAESLDDPRGMVHIRDVVGYLTRTARQAKPSGDAPAGKAVVAADLGRVDLSSSIEALGIVRPVLFVPPSMQATELMTRMQAARIQMALVIDEYGGTDGLVSLEDIIEMVFGDIEDEHDDDEPLITRTDEGIYVADARAEIEDAVEMIGAHFAAGEDAEDVETIGGLIFNALGRVPKRGEVVRAIPGFEFHVLDADPRRIKRVRIVSTEKAA